MLPINIAQHTNEKTEEVVTTEPVANSDDQESAGKPEVIDQTAAEQHGVQQAEAVTRSWSRKSLMLAFACMWLLYLNNAFQSSITNNLAPFVTSGFDQHSLLTVIYIVSASMTTAVYIPLAKMLDLWGRAEGFALMATFSTLGLIMMAATKNLETFCAAQVFHSIGFSGMTYTIDVITADSSSLKNRGLAFAFTASPYMISAFAGPKSAESFYEKINWRWGFGTFAIILPFVAAPFVVLLKLNLRKAKKAGLLNQEKTSRSLVQSVWYFANEFDIMGVVLLASGMVIFLLPFTLADSAPSGWSTGYIIAMIVLGFLLLVSFGLYERFLAPKPFVPYKLLTNRSVAGALLLASTYQISYYCWNSYFTSFLQVVTDVSIAEAGYISSTFDVISGVLLLGVGFMISKTGYFRWLLFIAVPIYIFGQGLMIYFRSPNTAKVGYLVMCQIFLAIGGSIIILCEQIAVLAAADHQQIAAALALLNLAGWLGGSIGSTISGAIWTNSFPQALAHFLPEEAQGSLEDIYGSLDVQLSYEVGSLERIAIQQAYGVAQQRMLVAGTAIMALALGWVFLIRNYDLSKIRQVKGMVF